MPGRRAFALALPLLFAPVAARGRELQIDARMGEIGFSVRYLGFLPARGVFTRFTARLRLDPPRPEATRVDCVIDAASATTRLPGAGEWLRGPAFLDAEAHPHIRFTGAALPGASARDLPLAGELTLRGVAAPFRLEARLVEAGGALRLEGEGRLARSAHGMVAAAGVVSDEVALSFVARLPG